MDKINSTLTIHDANGQPLAGQPVTVEQTRHKFLFGSTGFDITPLANGKVSGAAKERAELLNQKLLDLCNFITLPFYWGRFEPQRGQPITEQILNTARWFTERGCTVKGHPLAWHTVSAPWLLDLSTEEIIDVQLARIRREVADFAGVIDTWDVINEVVIMPNFDKYDNGITRMALELGRIGIIRATFDAARETNPGATLLLNDFDVSAAYECLIEGCLEAGIKIDVIGIQSHMHQGWWGLEKTLDVLERFSRFGLPLHFTETTLVSGEIMPAHIEDLNDYRVDEWPSTPEGEARQAEEAVTHYKTLFEHPLVEAITWWGLPDGGWLNAPSGLVRQDYSSKPAYDALLNLVKGEWWLAPTEMVTDEAGRLHLEAYPGEYAVTVQDRTAAFTLGEDGVVGV